MPMVLAFETFVVEFTATEVGATFPFESMMIVFVVGPVMIMAMPSGISIIGVTRIVSFKVDAYTNLGAGRLNGKRTGEDQCKGKKFRFHKSYFKLVMQ